MQKPHKVTIRMKEGSSGFMVGANTEVLIDGEKAKYVTGVKFEVDARGVAKVTMQFLANVEIEGDVELGYGSISDSQDEFGKTCSPRNTFDDRGVPVTHSFLECAAQPSTGLVTTPGMATNDGTEA